MALQSHPRTLILGPIESAYATSYWLPIGYCTILEILQVFCWEERPHLYSTRIWCVSLGL